VRIQATGNILHGESSSFGETCNSGVTIEEASRQLWTDARSRLMMPARGLVNSVKMSDTKLSNTLVMQPQQRNTSGRIFGGFLVRRAYELAFATAYRFSGVVPRFREIDEVNFVTPVDVGDLLHMDSRVLYTSYHMHQLPSVHVVVTANVMKPGDSSHTVSNSFFFTFEVCTDMVLPRIIPESLEESVEALTRYHADLIQKADDDEEEQVDT